MHYRLIHKHRDKLTSMIGDTVQSPLNRVASRFGIAIRFLEKS